MRMDQISTLQVGLKVGKDYESKPELWLGLGLSGWTNVWQCEHDPILCGGMCTIPVL
jgi:hypothetical protein